LKVDAKKKIRDSTEKGGRKKTRSRYGKQAEQKARGKRGHVVKDPFKTGKTWDRQAPGKKKSPEKKKREGVKIHDCPNDHRHLTGPGAEKSGVLKNITKGKKRGKRIPA